MTTSLSVPLSIFVAVVTMIIICKRDEFRVDYDRELSDIVAVCRNANRGY